MRYETCLHRLKTHSKGPVSTGLINIWLYHDNLILTERYENVPMPEVEPWSAG